MKQVWDKYQVAWQQELQNLHTHGLITLTKHLHCNIINAKYNAQAYIKVYFLELLMLDIS